MKLSEVRIGDRVRIKQARGGASATYEGPVRAVYSDTQIALGSDIVVYLTAGAMIELLSREEPIDATQIRPGMLVRLAGSEPARCTSEYWADGVTSYYFRPDQGYQFFRYASDIKDATRIVEKLNG